MFVTLLNVSIISNAKKINADKLTKFLAGIIKIYQ